MINFVLVFLYAFIIDVLWVLYIKHVSNDNKMMSAITSSIVGLLNAAFVIELVQDKYMMISWALGLFIGTYSGFFIEKINMKKINKIRHKIERKIDGFNHILEFVRTIASVIGACAGIAVFLKVFGLI